MTVLQHPNIIALEKNESLIRYFDLKKFEDLLKTNTLFFCRMDKFGDPHEGSIPLREYNWRKNSVSPKFSDFQRRIKTFTLLSCWQINTNESDLMWKTYLKNYQGVAIQISYDKLVEIMDESEYNFLLSKVRYIDYEKDIWYHKNDYPHRNYNTYTPIVHKKIEFSAESEFRIIFDIPYEKQTDDYWASKKIPEGEKINVRIIDIIEKVILPPKSDIVFREKVETIVDKYNLTLNIVESKIDNEPLF